MKYDFKTILITSSRSNIEKYLDQLMNDSVFGKTMETIRNTEEICSDEFPSKQAKETNFKNFSIFD